MPFDTPTSADPQGLQAGDTIIGPTYGPSATESVSRQDTAFFTPSGFGDYRLDWALIDQVANGDTAAAMSMRLNPGSGETATARFQNITDGETLAEVSSATTGPISDGFNTYTPTTTSSPIAVKIEVKTEPATNSSSFASPTLYVGHQL